ncbi:MAG TPA: hypothetical protein PLN94_01945, partial [Thiolinea sp.]|nr:hypothetical protein [Thiolinea sp.]
AEVLRSVFLDAGNESMTTNYISAGYKLSDVNMDGNTIAAGPGNDLNLILANVLVHPGNLQNAANYIVQQQLP